MKLSCATQLVPSDLNSSELRRSEPLIRKSSVLGKLASPLNLLNISHVLCIHTCSGSFSLGAFRILPSFSLYPGTPLRMAPPSILSSALWPVTFIHLPQQPNPGPHVLPAQGSVYASRSSQSKIRSYHMTQQPHLSNPTPKELKTGTQDTCT